MMPTMRHFCDIGKLHLRKQDNSGFTIAELLIVVAIVGVLVAIAIPVFTSSLESAKEGTCLANRRSAKGYVVAEYITTKADPAVSLATFLNQNQNLCPDGGDYRVEGSPEDGSLVIRCSKHGITMDEEMGSSIIGILGEGSWYKIIGSDGQTLKTDSGARKEYAKQKGLDSWPEVHATDGSPYYLQFKSYNNSTSSTFLYAGTNPNPMADSGLWVARYVCDSQGIYGEKGTWYELPKETGITGGEDVIKGIISTGKKVNLVGNKFEAA